MPVAISGVCFLLVNTLARDRCGSTSSIADRGYLSLFSALFSCCGSRQSLKSSDSFVAILRFPIERGARQVSRPSFTVQTPMLSLVTALVSIGNMLRYNFDVIALSPRMTKARLTWKNLNSKGRTLVNGCALSQDLQKLIVDKIVRNCGDINAGYFPGKF